MSRAFRVFSASRSIRWPDSRAAPASFAAAAHSLLEVARLALNSSDASARPVRDSSRHSLSSSDWRLASLFLRSGSSLSASLSLVS
ncbi:MAG: hypothetical protein LBR80_06745 [Deltaproteobacteria bacterium]|nr:hypothetical protein [Deltaproteobacteria bacterium]